MHWMNHTRERTDMSTPTRTGDRHGAVPMTSAQSCGRSRYSVAEIYQLVITGVRWETIKAGQHERILAELLSARFGWGVADVPPSA